MINTLVNENSSGLMRRQPDSDLTAGSWPVTQEHRIQTGLMLLLMLGSQAGLAAAPLSAEEEWLLGNNVMFLEDAEGNRELEDVRVSGNWRVLKSRTFNQGYSDSAWWLRFRINNPRDEAASRLLSIAYPVLDDIRIYKLSGDVEAAFYQLGSNYPFSQRPIEHRYFVVPLTWEGKETLDIYLRVRSSSALQVPLALWHPDAFYSRDADLNVLHGTYFGAMLVIAAYNLLLYFALRERNYLNYVLFVVSMALLMATLTGFSFRYLWPEATSWNDRAILVSLSAVLGFAAVFSRRFLRIREISVALDRGAVVLIVASVLAALMAFVASYSLVIHLLIPLIIAACFYGLAAGIYAWYCGQITAKYYVVAWSMLLLGGITLALSKGGVLPSNTFTDHAAQIGSLFEVVLLSFALAQRINVERKLRFEAQSETLETTRRHNFELEERVQLRTRELEVANLRLSELSQTDGLTGLKNRRFLDEALLSEVERARRTGRMLAVVMVDIDHFKPVNDTHGHAVGDDCLKMVGEVIASGLRWPSDIAARYGGEEFALIIPDTSAEGALTVVERIRETIRSTPVSTHGLSLTLTVSIGVYATHVGSEVTPEHLLERADQALYDAKNSGRDQTRIYQPATSH